MSTTITYEGVEQTLEQLAHHKDCAIPHRVKSFGVSLQVDCPSHGTYQTLRVTEGHLIFTNDGLKAAGDLKPGDKVFADLDETRVCVVRSKVREQHQQEYFGLNCRTSEVLASGIKASAFETLHTIPSLWMRYIGGILGVERASALGDTLARYARVLGIV